MEVGDKLKALKTVFMTIEGKVSDRLYIQMGKEYPITEIDEHNIYFIKSEYDDNHCIGTIESAREHFIIPETKVDIFTEDFLEEIGHKQTLSNNEYGRCQDKSLGMTQIAWNTEGCNVTYYGKLLAPNTAITIYKDGGTRIVFNGYVFTQDDVRRLLTLTM